MPFKHKYKHRITILLSTILSILIVAGSVIIYLRTAAIMKKQVLETSESTVVQLQTAVETVISVLNESLTQTALDEDIRSFADRFELLDIFDIEDVYKRLYQLRSTNKYFESLYVYYFNDARVIDLNKATARLVDLDSLSNKNILTEAYNKYSHDTAANLFAINAGNGDNNENTLAIIMPVSPVEKKPRALIIMTLDKRYFQSILSSLSIEEEANLYVVDENGTLMFGKKTRMATAGSVKTKGSKNGSLQLNIGGEDYLSTFTTSKNTKWTYIYEVPAKFVFSKIEAIRTFLLLLALMGIIYTAVTVRVLTREIYKPVEKLVSTIRQEGEMITADVNDELEFINKNINSLMTEKKSLKQLLTENLPFLRNDVLVKLLNGDFNDSGELDRKISYYNINLPADSYYTVCIIALDRETGVRKNYSEEDIKALLIYEREAVQNYLKYQEGISAEFVNISENKLVAILSISSGMPQEQAKKEIKSLCQIISDDVRYATKLTMTIGIGNIAESVIEIPDIYEQAVSAFEYRVILGDDRIIEFSRLPLLSEAQYNYPFKLEREIFSCMKQADLSLLDQALRRYFDYAKANTAEYNIIRYTFTQLLNSMLKALNEISVDSKQIFPEIGDMYIRVLSLDTIDHAYEYFHNIFKQITGYLSSKKQNSECTITQKVIEYLDKNYCDEKISLDLLAGEMHFSVSYLVKEFKQNTGKSIKEYITEKRIEKAKELLSANKYKISEVGQKIGYPNSQSFINIFKKYVGETPGEFKSAVQ